MENNTNVSYFSATMTFHSILLVSRHLSVYCHGFTETFLNVKQDPVVPGLSPAST